MGTLVPSMQKGDLHQADICGMFLLFFFFTPLKNMQAKKNTTGLVPLGIFFFSEAVMFHFGSSYLLASVFPGAAAWTWLQRLWLVCPPTSPAQPSGSTLQHLPLPIWQRGGFATVFVAADLSPLFLPSASHGSLQ